MASSNCMAGRWWLAGMLFALACVEVWFGRSVYVLRVPVQFSRLMWSSDAVWALPWCWWLISGTSALHRWDWMSCPLSAEAAISYIWFKVPLTAFLVNLPIGRRHWRGTFFFLSTTSLGAWSSLWLCSFLSPRLSSSSPAPDGQQSGEDTGRGRCVYLPETKHCSGADGNAPGRAALSDTAVTLHWSPHCRQNLLSLTVALNVLFVAFRIWQYKPCHQSWVFFPVNFVTFSSNVGYQKG